MRAGQRKTNGSAFRETLDTLKNLGLKYSKTIYWVVFGILVLLFIFRIKAILPPFLFALVIAYVLDPAVAFFEKRHLSRTASIVFVYVLLILVLVLIGTYVFSSLISELSDLMVQIPDQAGHLQNVLDHWQSNYIRARLPQGIRNTLDDVLQRYQSRLTLLIDKMASSLLNILGSLAPLLFSPLLAFYILKDLKEIKLGIYKLIPLHNKARIWSVLVDIEHVWSSFIRGQLLIAAIIASLASLILLVLGVPYPLVAGLAGGFGEFVPYFGPIIGAIPGVLFALTRSGLTAVKVILAFLLLQQIEANFITPRIIGSRVGLHPIVVIFALMVGGYLFGFWGVVLAAPVAGMLKVLIKAYICPSAQNGGPN